MTGIAISLPRVLGGQGSPYGILSIVTRLPLDDAIFVYWQVQEISVFSKTCSCGGGGLERPARGLFPGVGGSGKSPGHEADHSHPSCAKVKNEWSYTSTPPVCLRGMCRDNLTFTSCWLGNACDTFPEDSF